MSASEILVIDDDVNMLMFYLQHLDPAKYGVRVTNNVSHGLSQLFERPHRFSVLIANLEMEGLNLEEWLDWCASAELLEARIIIVSDSPQLLKLTKGKNSVSAIAKPLTADVLIQAVDVLARPDWKEVVELGRSRMVEQGILQ
jgi:DNA-binding NtrC family response regulator